MEDEQQPEDSGQPEQPEDSRQPEQPEDSRPPGQPEDSKQLEQPEDSRPPEEPEEPGEEQESRISHDAAYKRFFSQPPVIESLFVHLGEAMGLDPEIAENLDFDKAEDVSQESIDEDNKKIINDLVMKIPWLPDGESPDDPPLLLAVEFQRDPAAWMHVRMMHYIDGVYGRIAEAMGPGAPPPQLLGFVLYHGHENWPGPRVPRRNIYDNNRPGMQVAGTHPERRVNLMTLNVDDMPEDAWVPAWCRIEQAGDDEEKVIAALKAIFTKYSDPKYDAACRALYNRASMLGYCERNGLPVPYEEVRHDILGGNTNMTYMTAVQLKLQESEQKGRQEGRQEERQEGLARQREQLCRLAARKFYADTAGQLEILLEAIDDPDVLAAIGENIIDYESGGEFIDACRRLGPLH